MDAFTLTCIGLRVLGAAYLALIAAYLPALAIWLPGNYPGPEASLALFSCAAVGAISVFLVLLPGLQADAGRFRALRDAHAPPPDQGPLLDAVLRLTGLAMAASGLARFANTAAEIAAYFVVPGASAEPYAGTRQIAWLVSPLISMGIGVLLLRTGSSLIHHNGGQSDEVA